MINTQVESRGKAPKISQSGDGDGARGMRPTSSSARDGGAITEGKSRGKKVSATAAMTSGGTGARKTPSHDEIAALAHQIYVKKGCPQGRDLENWLEAEEQLRR